jgi:hypothetical protein
MDDHVPSPSPEGQVTMLSSRQAAHNHAAAQRLHKARGISRASCPGRSCCATPAVDASDTFYLMDQGLTARTHALGGPACSHFRH